jgi:hypothetical protein
MLPAMPRPAPEPAPLADPRHRPLVLALAGLVGLAVVLVVVGSWPVQLGAVLVLVCVGQGVWRGGAAVVAIVAALVLAAVTAPWIGRAIEGAVGSAFGLGGLAARGMAMLLAGAVIATTIAAVGTRVLGAASKRWALWREWDRWIGAGVGLVEGVLLTLVVCWSVLALTPIAATRTEIVREAGGDPASAEPLAARVLAAGRVLRGSVLGGVAAATSPLGGSRLLELINDFVVVARDEEAMAWFMQTQAMQRAAAVPGMEAALASLRADPAVAQVLDRDGPMETRDVLAILNSNAVLDLLDHSPVVGELSALSDEIASALSEARARVKPSG